MSNTRATSALDLPASTAVTILDRKSGEYAFILQYVK